ncbi:MAG TPA: VOC family protein, partial [bacterium]|nr:VOC family protein [bacterium]
LRRRDVQVLTHARQANTNHSSAWANSPPISMRANPSPAAAASDCGIDHLVLCVNDLAQARAAYGRLGFTTTPPAQHPFATGNSLVQLQGNFLELLAITRPEQVSAPVPGQFSFPAFCRDFLAEGEGLCMLVFASQDARADQAQFAAAGLQTYAPFDFSRQATLPDGSQATVAFSLAFVTHPEMQRAAFFVCQQHAPQHFWQAVYQRHANTAQQVTEVFLLAQQPQALSDWLGRLQPGRRQEVAPESVSVHTARGTFTVLSPQGAARRFPGAPLALTRGPRLVGYRVSVGNLAAAQALWQAQGIPFQRSDGVLRLAPQHALGVVLELAAIEPSGTA